jgi:lysophospholipase L1-like esterase
MGIGRHRKGLSRALLVVVALLATAGLCEGLIRFFHLQAPRFIQHDPVYGASHIPGQAGYYQKDPPSYIVINGKGFRGPERSYEKPPGTYRIVVIGDSYIEAFSVPYEQTLTHLVEERLQAEGYPVEVVNLGMSNFGTAQELLLLEREGVRYHPDLVVLAFYQNDPADNYRPLSGDPNRPYFRLTPDGRLERPLFRPPMSSRGVVRDFMRRHLRIYTFFPKRIQEAVRRVRRKTTKGDSRRPHETHRLYAMASHALVAAKPEGAGAPASTASTTKREAWEVTYALIKEFRRVTEAQGAQFVFLDIPEGWVAERVWDRFATKNPEPQSLLQAFCEREEMRCLLLLPLFREVAARGVKLYGDHWNAEGHRVAAEALVELIRPLVASSVERT